MSYSQTVTSSNTFTITHARYMSSKVAADLRRMQRFYDSPSNDRIIAFEEEVAQLLKNGYLEKAIFGFKRDGNWIEPTFSYTANELSNGVDDMPGQLRPNADVSGASFGSFVEYSSKYFNLTEEEKNDFKSTLPIQRVIADTPGISGYLENDKNYSAGDRSLSRSTVRSY